MSLNTTDQTKELFAYKQQTDELRDCVERLVHVRDTIRKYGISEPMMRIADPSEELISAGVCGSYESLNIMPVHDDIALDVAAGIDSIIVRGDSKLDLTYEGLFDRLKQIFKRKTEIKDVPDNLETLLTTLESITSFDDKKFSTIEIRGHSKTYVKRVINIFSKSFTAVDSSILYRAVDELYKMLKNDDPRVGAKRSEYARAIGSRFRPIAGNKETKEIFGFEVIVKNGEFISTEWVKPNQLIRNKTTATMKKLGWTIDDLPSFGRDIATMTGKLEKLGSYGDPNDTPDEDAMSTDGSPDRRVVIKYVQTLIEAIWDIYYHQSGMFDRVYGLEYEFETIAKAAISCKQDTSDHYAQEELTLTTKREDLPDSAFGDVKNRKYPIDTEEHTRAAWSYINMPKNVVDYTEAELEIIKGRIKRAAKKFGIEINEENA